MGADAESSGSDVDVMDALRTRVAADVTGVQVCGRVEPATRGAAALLSEFCIRNVGDQPTTGIIQHGRSDLHMYSNIAKEALDPHIPKKSMTEKDISRTGASSNLLCKALYAHLLEDGQRAGVKEVLDNDSPPPSRSPVAVRPPRLSDNVGRGRTLNLTSG